MPLTFDEWGLSKEPGEIVDVRDRSGWDLLRERYADGLDAPLERIIEIAIDHGVETVLVEFRYIDADWRSEHANFYGSTFRRYPSICHRLHFFTSVVSADFDGLAEHAEAYRGYSVMRPLPGSPVGRTMITPPAELSGAATVKATETVNLFGFNLAVTAMPFISQDAQYLRCAHASIWMILRHATLHHGLPKRLPGEIREAGVGGYVVGRQLPSAGLSVAQMLDALDRLGLPAGLLEPQPNAGPAVRPEPGSLSLYGVLCRYVNSDLPPIVVSYKHAWVVVAWRRTASAGHTELTLWRHDDARGPYIRVDDPWNEPDPAHDPWRLILTPLMPKMNIDAERAEATGAAWMELMINSWGTMPDGSRSRAAEALANGDLAWRTFAVPSNGFKSRLAIRGLDASLVSLYRTTQMPRYIWVIEAVDRGARSASKPDVLGEIILDSTHASPRKLAISGLLCGHLEATAFSQAPDHTTTQMVSLTRRSHYLGDQIAR